MKNVFGVFILLIFLVSLGSFGLAQEENGTYVPVDDETVLDENSINLESLEDETVSEVKAFSVPLGAKIRLMQLERSILKNAVRTRIVVDYVYNSGKDVSELESILSEMESVLEETSALSEEDSVENSVESYVALKKQGLDLTQEFRLKTKEYLTPEDVSSLKESLDSADYSVLDTLKEETRTVAREYNARKFENIMGEMNKEDQGIGMKIRSGELGPQEVREKVRTEFKDASNDVQKKIVQRVREEGKSVGIENAKSVLQANAGRISLIRSEVRERVRDKLENSEFKEAIQARILNNSARIALKENIENGRLGIVGGGQIPDDANNGERRR
ncbi:hypothetical protein K9L97_03045 [Candidatus Woesearchaeota archaeon]|nr:hypothetical protein [Candidatus Woesearchaeota archaeon]